MCRGIPYINAVITGNGYNVVSEYHSKDINKEEDWQYFHDAYRTQSRVLQSVGEPYVYHVNFENITELEHALQSIKKNPLDKPFFHPFYKFSNYIERFVEVTRNHVKKWKEKI